MRFRFALLLFIPARLPAQQVAAIDGRTTIEIRSADSAQHLSVRMDYSGRLVSGVGRLPLGPRSTTARGSGTTTTPSAIHVAEESGDITMRAPSEGPAIIISVLRVGTGDEVVARGHVIVISRSAPNASLQITADSIFAPTSARKPSNEEL